MKAQKKLYSLVLAALIAAVTCVLAPFAIPLPMTPVPISLTNLVIFFSLYLIGWKWSLVSFGVYYLLGLAGLPVFSGFTGGFGKAAGPTGGYLIGFFFLIFIAGIFVERYPSRPFLCVAGMVCGMIVAYAFGLSLIHIFIASRIKRTLSFLSPESYNSSSTPMRWNPSKRCSIFSGPEERNGSASGGNFLFLL